MLTTFTTVVFFLGLFLAFGALWMLFLHLGLLWVKAGQVTTWRLLAAFLLTVVLQPILWRVAKLAVPDSDAFILFEIALAILVPCGVTIYVFRVTTMRAFLVWLFTLIPSILSDVSMQCVVRPFIFETYTSPTNAMAPTMIGSHWRGICPTCGRASYCTAARGDIAPVEPSRMICEGFHVEPGTSFHKERQAGDRFLVNKLLNPRRWDVITFNYPSDPALLYAMRLVGLPGETIYIDEGAVFIDGRRLPLPKSLTGLKYESEATHPDFKLWGTKSRPAVLGDDEYFVLGDFSERSADSRYWDRGAPGHNPFAVPRSHLTGVVTHIYWPIWRW